MPDTLSPGRAAHATGGLPPNGVVEMGARIEL
jgi:hypothetical protein